jgi:hemerythrin-like domain-containing protein
MQKYLNTPIKEIITKFPNVGKILEEYHIGCVPCTLGSCLLKDVVAIHNLSADDETELMYRIEKQIYPNKDVKKPVPRTAVKRASAKEIKYSPVIKRLVDEHTLIKKWIALIPEVLASFDVNNESHRQIILGGIDFIRFYADKFHHAKEEDILFDYTDKNLDIIKTILSDHEAARAHVRATLEALKLKDKHSVIEHLSAYKDLLTEHIKKEDEILYPWIERGLSVTQVGELFSKFDAAEEKIDKEVIAKCKKFIDEIEKRIQNLKLKKQEVKK